MAYTEDQLLAQIRGISDDIAFRIKDGIVGLQPLVRLKVILENTPSELKSIYANEITEFTSLCHDLEQLALRGRELSESVNQKRVKPSKVRETEQEKFNRYSLQTKSYWNKYKAEGL